MQGGKGGFLRNPKNDYPADSADVSVALPLCNKFGLRGGEMICGIARVDTRNPRNRRAELLEITTIDDVPIDKWTPPTPFEKLTAIDPEVRIQFSTPEGAPSMRVVDLMTPIGLGQRGLIVAPPRTGKTILLQQMADGIATNHPDAKLFVLLVDERPEEVTQMKRTVRGEVVASSNDQPVANHIRVARLVIARAKRLVERGKNVIILLDSLTRLGRSFNTETRGVGRIMSGGLDAGALNEPKAIFGAARKVEHGGSLTIVASALIETGSRMDEVIFNEFKGTGNMEIMLSRAMADRRVFPAIDLQTSGTRKEELLLDAEELSASHTIRRKVIGSDPMRAMEDLIASLSKYRTNLEFAASIATTPRFSRRRLS